MNLGEMVINLRESRNITQKDLANKIGINRSVLNRIEQGTRPARDEEIKCLASFFGVPTDYLLGNDVPTSGGWMPMSKSNNKDTKEALAWLDKYEQLDGKGKETINNMIDIALKNR